MIDRIDIAIFFLIDRKLHDRRTLQFDVFIIETERKIDTQYRRESISRSKAYDFFFVCRFYLIGIHIVRIIHIDERIQIRQRQVKTRNAKIQFYAIIVDYVIAIGCFFQLMIDLADLVERERIRRFKNVSLELRGSFYRSFPFGKRLRFWRSF